MPEFVLATTFLFSMRSRESDFGSSRFNLIADPKVSEVLGVVATGEQEPYEESCWVDLGDELLLLSSVALFLVEVIINNCLLLCFGIAGKIGLKLEVISIFGSTKLILSF